MDRSLGKYVVADALRSAGEKVEVHDAHFPQNAKDEQWLKRAGQKGWIVLTKDSRIRYRGIELSSITKYKVRAFVLTARNLKGKHMADIFVDSLPAIRKLVSKHEESFVARITRSCNVKIIFPDVK